jgi:hypothetical protein
MRGPRPRAEPPRDVAASLTASNSAGQERDAGDSQRRGHENPGRSGVPKAMACRSGENTRIEYDLTCPEPTDLPVDEDVVDGDHQQADRRRYR